MELSANAWTAFSKEPGCLEPSASTLLIHTGTRGCRFTEEGQQSVPGEQAEKREVGPS